MCFCVLLRTESFEPFALFEDSELPNGIRPRH